MIKAGTKDLVLKVTQEPEFRYLLQENFDHPNVYVFADLPSGWTTLDDDKDGRNWRSYRDSETNKTYAYSASFDYDREWDLTPDNYMASPLFTVPVESFSVKWDVQAYDAEYLGDKYEVWVGTIVDRIIYLAKKVYEGVTTSATEPTHCEVSLDEYKDLTICIVFRHYDSSGLSAILISNVEVSNRH